MRAFPLRFALALLLFLAAACAPVADESTARPADLAAFAKNLESALTSHAWQTILASTHPVLYRSRVVDDRTEEPAFIADLLGIRAAVQEGDVLDWSDLERIESADLIASEDGLEEGQIGGTVTLDDGSVLRVSATTTRVQGRFVLTDVAP